MAELWVHAAIARYSGLLGPRDGILRTACRRLIMRAACAKHGARLAFDGDHIGIIRISGQHFAFALDMSRAFEEYFTPVAPVAEEINS